MSYDFNKEKFSLIGSLTPNLIHDIRNSISVLKLNYYYLNLKEDSIPSEIVSSLNDCSEAISRLEKKMDNFSLLIANQDNTKEICNLNFIIAVAIDLLKGKAKKTNIALEDISASDSPMVKVNKSKISVAVIEIINTLLDTGISNQKIVLNVLANNAHQLKLEIEKKIKDSKHSQFLNDDNLNLFFRNIDGLRDSLQDDDITISFEGDVKQNCKIIFSFTK